MGRAATANGQEIGGRGFSPATAANPVQALPERMGDGGGHGLPGFVREKLGEFVGFGVLDVEAHVSTILHYFLPFYLSGLRGKESSAPLKGSEVTTGDGKRPGSGPAPTGSAAESLATSQATARVVSDAGHFPPAAGVEFLEVRPLAGGWRWI